MYPEESLFGQVHIALADQVEGGYRPYFTVTAVGLSITLLVFDKEKE
jgi:hypothetical protein